MDKILSFSLPPQKIDPADFAKIRRSGQSWWQARYSSGKVLSEWETTTTGLILPDGRPPQGPNTSRWEGVDKDGMVGLRLLCPNGMCGELEAPEGHLFIQLKLSMFQVGSKEASRSTLAHIIGVITDPDGRCFCRAWEYGNRQLVEFHDNIFNMRYQGIGKLSLDVQGVKL